MATSGTIGQTIISTNKVLEHALRRAGLLPSQQTPEIVDIAKECLFLLLAHYSNTGLNLWCVEPKIIDCVVGQKTYDLPIGTTSILNVVYATPVISMPASYDGNEAMLAAVTQITRLGIKFSVLPDEDQFQISTITPGGSSVVQYTGPTFEITSTDQYYWFDMKVVGAFAQINISAGTGVVESIKVASTVSEIPMSPFNRDDYSSMPNKDTTSEVCTNYLFNKALTPNITVWPIPTHTDGHIVVWVHRQVQDVGKLTQSLAIPTRWFEATIIQLAFRLSMELPGVDPARIKMLLDLSGKFSIEAGNEETDSAPIRLQPNISPYTR